MALKMNYEARDSHTDKPLGVNGEYWSIVDLGLSLNRKYMRVDLTLHLDEQAKKVGMKGPIQTASVTFTAEDAPTLEQLNATENVLQLAYNKLKTLPFFSEAENV